MRVSSKLIALFLFSCSLIAIGQIAFGQNDSERTYRANIHLNESEEANFKVEVFTPKVGSKKAAYIFRPTSSSGFGNIPIQEYIRNFRAFDEKGKDLKVDLFDLSSFVVRGSQKLDRITYEVWEPEESFQRDFHPHGLMIVPEEFYLINFHLALGYLNNFIYLPYEITVYEGEKKTKLSSLNYTELENQTLFLGNIDHKTFQLNGIDYESNVYSEDADFNTNHFNDNIAAIVEDALTFLNKTEAQHKTFNIVIKESKNQSGFGGSVHGDAYTFVLPNTKNKVLFRQRLNNVLMHEVLHTLAPYSLHSHITDLKHRTQFEYSEHLWLYEGVTEYLALLALLRSERMDEKTFRNQIAKKYHRSMQFPAHSLSETSLERNKEKRSLVLPDIYYKGAVVAFLLDIEINRLSDQKWNLLEVLTELNKTYTVDQAFREDELFAELNNICDCDLNPFYRHFIESDQAIDLNKFIPLMGWNFFEEKSFNTLTFGKFKLNSDEKAHTFRFDKVGANSLGLLEGDLLRGMNTVKTNNDSYAVQVSTLLNPSDEAKIFLSVERNGSEISLEGEPQEKAWVKKNLILENEEMSAETRLFKETLLYDKSSR